MLFITRQKDVHCIMWSTCIGDCWLQFFVSAFMFYIMVISISVDLKRTKMFPIKAVFDLIFVVVCSSCWNIFQICNKSVIICYKTILPENKSNQMGVNKHPYLGIKIYPSHLTCFSLQYQEQLYNDQFLFSFCSTTFSTFVQ